MRRAVLPALLLLLSVPAFSQKVAITVNPLTAFFGIANVGVEIPSVWRDKTSLRVNLSYLRTEFFGVNIAFYGLEGAGRYYFGGKPAGAFGEAGLGIMIASLGSSAGSIVYPYSQIGYRFGSKVFLDLAVGASALFISITKDGETQRGSAFLPRFEVGVGIMF